LRYRNRSGRNLIPCEVIARDMTGWWISLRLGKGFLDGLDKDLAVITPDGLIGRTIEVTPRTADVLLVSDHSCQVSVELVRTGTFGILTGQGRHPRGQALCRVDFLNKNAEIRPGDEVLTSGLGGVFPKGLLIGHVQRVETNPAGLSKRAHVLTQARLGGLTYVFVVQEEVDPAESLLIRRAQEERDRP
jgi:rod shape-determining protein MreC